MKITFFALITVIIVIIGSFAYQKNQKEGTATQNVQESTATPSSIKQEPTNISASFTIMTNGLIRDFTNSRYHNLSPDVYIESQDPSKVQVTKSGITWDNFFKTLPMQVTKDCLVTGTRQTFCTDKNGTLRFYLNDREDENLLNKEIKNGDKVLIEFSKT